MNSRNELPAFLHAHGLMRFGVEVGTYRGEFAQHLLNHWPGHLTCVDPWVHQTDWDDLLNHDDFGMEMCYQNTLERLAPWIREGRCTILRAASVTVAHDWLTSMASLLPGKLPVDWVYLDARHDYDHAAQDIAAWWPIVRAGGVLAGHDYLDTVRGPTVFGVKRAVDEFGDREALMVQTTPLTADGCYPSWWIQKPADP